MTQPGVRSDNHRMKQKSSFSNARNGGSVHLYDDGLSILNFMLRGRKNSSGKKIKNFAEVAHEISHSLPEMPNLQEYATAAANQLDNLAGYVSKTDIDEMLGDAMTFAHRRPLTTFGIAAITGFALSRMFMPGTARATRRQRGHRKSHGVAKAKGSSRKSSVKKPPKVAANG